MKLMNKIRGLMGEKAGTKLVLLFVLPLLGSVLETLGVSTIVAFITMIMDESVFQSNELLKQVYIFTGAKDYKTFVILMASLLIVFYVFKTVYLTLQYYIQNKIVKQTQHNLAAKLFHIIINRPYEYFVNVNVAELTRIISEDVTRTGDYILNFVQMLSEFLTAFMLVMMLLVIDTKMTIFICMFLLGCMVVIRVAAKRKLKEAGKVQQYNFKERQKWLNQSVYGIKDIKICRNEAFFENKFCEANQSWNETEIVYSFWNRTPSFLIELVIMLTILIYLIVVVASGSNINEMITTLSAFAFSAVRLLPACNRISSYMTTMSYRQHSFNLIYDMVSESEKEIEIQENDDACQIGEMKQGVFGKDISFNYLNAEKKIFEHANIDIPKGMSIGIIGPSGSGKTTIVDILLGLLKPQSGKVEMDEVDIQENYSSYLDKVSYIPQNIFLIDDTIKNNVAYGIEEENISEERVWKALEEAQIKEYVEKLPEGLETVVGDRGVRISGGQRQRIGIARALYSNPEILVFDEATSALDNETEAAIMESINYFKGKKTMIIIAHRLTTIEKCDIVYRVEDGCVEKLEDRKSYEV